MSYLFIYIWYDSLVEMEERMKITGNDAKGPPPPKKKTTNGYSYGWGGGGGGCETEAHARL